MRDQKHSSELGVLMFSALRLYSRRLLPSNAGMNQLMHYARHEAIVAPRWVRFSKRRFVFERRPTLKIALVQSISIFRIIAILIFASLAFGSVPRLLLIFLYAFAMVSDLLDGYLARKLEVATYFGKVMDLVADKSLTAVSLLYAAERGVSLLPLALIATRDIVMIGMRLITVEGEQLLPTNRVFGGVMASVLGANTLVLMYAQTIGLMKIANIVYWACSFILVANLCSRIYASAPRITAASASEVLKSRIGE